MQFQPNRSGPDDARCTACGSRRVVAMDLVTNKPLCLRHAAAALAYFDGLRDATLNLVDRVVGEAVRGGHIHPDDLVDAVGEPVAAGEAGRASMPQVPTFYQVQEAVAALEAYDRLGEEG
jgi:hypothetical protein